MRGRTVRSFAGLITQRSGVQIPFPHLFGGLMKHHVCDVCGCSTNNDYIEVITEGSAGVVMCKDCLHPIPEAREQSFEEWWKQFEEYQKLKKLKGAQWFRQGREIYEVQTDVNLKISN